MSEKKKLQICYPHTKDEIPHITLCTKERIPLKNSNNIESEDWSDLNIKIIFTGKIKVKK